MCVCVCVWCVSALDVQCGYDGSVVCNYEVIIWLLHSYHNESFFFNT